MKRAHIPVIATLKCRSQFCRQSFIARSNVLEDVKAGSAGPVFFQLYLMGGRGSAEAVIERARVAGYGALVVTIDTPVSGIRDGGRFLGRICRQIRNACELEEGSSKPGRGSSAPDTQGRADHATPGLAKKKAKEHPDAPNKSCGESPANVGLGAPQ